MHTRQKCEKRTSIFPHLWRRGATEFWQGSTGSKFQMHEGFLWREKQVHPFLDRIVKRHFFLKKAHWVLAGNLSRVLLATRHQTLLPLSDGVWSQGWQQSFQQPLELRQKTNCNNFFKEKSSTFILNLFQLKVFEESCDENAELEVFQKRVMIVRKISWTHFNWM